MKKNYLLLCFVAATFFCSCDNNDVLKTTAKDKPADPTIQEVAFPDKNKTKMIVAGEVIEVTADNEYIYQGDILFTEEQLNDMKDISTRGAILNQSKYKWPDGIIYYSIVPGITDGTRGVIYDAIDHWEGQTMIKFIPRSNQKDYIEFFNGNGCWSNLGKVGGKQQISIDASWATRGNVIHEIGHAVGLLHEHSRNDRDNYINVNYSNIRSDERSNYDKSNASQNMTNIYIGELTGMDYQSIMIYGSFSQTAINPDVPVMTRKKDNSTWSAQRNFLSMGDKSTIGTIYGSRPGGGGITK